MDTMNKMIDVKKEEFNTNVEALFTSLKQYAEEFDKKTQMCQEITTKADVLHKENKQLKKQLLQSKEKIVQLDEKVRSLEDGQSMYNKVSFVKNIEKQLFQKDKQITELKKTIEKMKGMLLVESIVIERENLVTTVEDKTVLDKTVEDRENVGKTVEAKTVLDKTVEDRENLVTTVEDKRIPLPNEKNTIISMKTNEREKGNERKKIKLSIFKHENKEYLFNPKTRKLYTRENKKTSVGKLQEDGVVVMKTASSSI